MRTMTISLGMAITLACSPVAAALLDAAAEPPARSLPTADRYDDPDPAARYVPLSLTTTEFASRRDRLHAVERALERSPDDPRLLVERGFQRHAMGQHDLAEVDYARALAAAGDNLLLRRRVLWSHGWALLNAGSNERALEAWAEAERLHGGRPFWAPYSRALAEWRLGRRDAAVASWQQAVEGLPVLGTEAGLLGRTAYWPGEQFETVRAVFGAWSEQHEGAAAR
ncbi:MAG: tetratricopeptide repeat protein [Lysobacteraceae bacterium]